MLCSTRCFCVKIIETSGKSQRQDESNSLLVRHFHLARQAGWMPRGLTADQKRIRAFGSPSKLG